MSDKNEPIQRIPPHGGYQDLQTYKTSEIVYDVSNRFINIVWR